MEYTEKEKKTIENIKDEFHINGLGARYTELKSEDLEILLSLLEKQRKEIEKLKEHLNQYYDGKLFTANQLKATEKEQNKYFIHKDKIREKIKDIEERIEEENEMLELNQICKEDYESRVKYLNYALNIYKRLLGDE